MFGIMPAHLPLSQSSQKIVSSLLNRFIINTGTYIVYFLLQNLDLLNH